MTNYTITSTTQFMENHLAAQPLEAQSALTVVKTADNHVLLFSIDQSKTLRVTVGQDAHATGWSTQAISSGIPASSGTTLTVKAFGATQAIDSSTGQPSTVTLAVAVTATTSTGSSDQLYVTSLTPDAGAAWITTPSTITWTPRPFDFSSTLLPDLTATTLNIADIMLTTLTAGSVFAVVTVVDPASGIDRPFSVDLTPTDTSSLWTYLVPEQDYTKLMDSTIGQPQGTLTAGLYKLYSYTSNGVAEVALTFKPRAAQYPARYFNITQNATALATIPVTTAGGETYTTLLVADGGSLVVYSFNDTTQDSNNYYTGTAAVSNPSGTTILNNVSALYAAVDGGQLAIWGVNGAKQVFYLQASIGANGVLSNWSVPLPLLSNVVRAVPYLSESRQLTAIYAIVTDPSTQVESLVELSRDPVVGSGWTRCQIQLPATNAYVTLQTYTTRVQVTDVSTNLSAAATVNITASHSAVLMINGLCYTLNPTKPFSIATASDGSFTLMQVVGGLGAPTYSFAVVDPSSGQAQSQPAIDPTAGVRSVLATYTSGQQLLQVQTTTAQGQPKPLLSSVMKQSTDEQNTIANQIASGIQSACGVATGDSTSSLPIHVAASSSSVILADLGDLVQAVANAFEDVTAWVEQNAEGAWQLAVQIGETTFNAIIKTTEDIANCIVALFNAVATIFEDIFRWLAFLFNWDNILTIQKQLVNFYNTLLTSAGSISSQALTTLGAWIEYLGQELENEAQTLLSQLPDQTPTSLSAQSQSAQSSTGRTSAVASTDPRMHWGQSQMSSGSTFSSSTSAVSNTGPVGTNARTATSTPGNTDPVLQAVNTLTTGLTSASAGWVSSMSSLVDGTGTVKTVVGDILESIGTLVTDTGAVVEAVGTDIDSLFATLTTGLNTNLQIPLFTALYSDITDGESLDVLNLFCLLQAVPSALIYDIATNGKSQAENFLPASQVTQLSQTLAAAAATLPQPPKPSLGVPSSASIASTATTPSIQAHATMLLATTANTTSTASGTSVTSVEKNSTGTAPANGSATSESVDPLQIILGTLHVARVISTLLVSAADESFDAAEEAGEISQAVADAMVLAYRIDNVIWCLEGMLDLADEHDSELTIFIGGSNTALGALMAYLSQYAGTSLGAGAIGGMRCFFSFWIGIAEIVNGIRMISDADGNDEQILEGAGAIAYGANELLEGPQDLIESAETTLLVIRSGLMLGAGMIDVIEGFGNPS